MENRSKLSKGRSRIAMSMDQIQELMDGNGGVCLACGEEAHGVEPDARNYECEACGSRKVFGMEEAILMGVIAIDD